MDYRPEAQGQVPKAFKPLLETRRLRPRLMDEADLDDLPAIFGDPKVMAAFNAEPFSRGQMCQWLQRKLDHRDRYGYGLFSVIHKDDDLLLGDCGLEHMEAEGKPVVEVGYDFRRDWWNPGFATELAALVRDFTFEALRLPSLVSLIRAGNGASRRVSEKIGLQRVHESARSGVRYWKYAV
jgi:ribosomal-protein-alanine N-acetyltransferase